MNIDYTVVVNDLQQQIAGLSLQLAIARAGLTTVQQQIADLTEQLAEQTPATPEAAADAEPDASTTAD